MESWLIVNRSEKHRGFQMNWEMGSRSPDPLGQRGNHSDRGRDPRKWWGPGISSAQDHGNHFPPLCLGVSICIMGALEMLISEVSSNPRFLGIFYSSLVAERQMVSSRQGTAVPTDLFFKVWWWWLLTSLAQGPCGVHSSTNSLWFYSNFPEVAQSREKTRPHYPSLWWGEGSKFQQVWSMVGKMRPHESPVGLDTGFSGPEPPRLLHFLSVLSHEAHRDPSPTILRLWACPARSQGFWRHPLHPWALSRLCADSQLSSSTSGLVLSESTPFSPSKWTACSRQPRLSWAYR